MTNAQAYNKEVSPLQTDVFTNSRAITQTMKSVDRALRNTVKQDKTN